MRAEVKVGIMFVVAIVLVALFAFYLGAFNPFSNSNKIVIAYNYAGGIDIGSPVRVMGIKVGKVTDIRFAPKFKMPKTNEEVKLLVTITVEKRAWATIREDSKYFINLAGVIGEKFIEITPGSTQYAQLKPGAIVRGEDPPRIDQLISQSYGLAGEIIKLIQNNEGSVVGTIQMMNNLVTNLNSLLKQIDRTASHQDVNKLVQNLVSVTGDVAFMTHKLRSPDGQKTLALMNKLIWRLKDLDGPTLRKFFQKEGIRAKLF